jgi:hypothetical protein
LCNYKGDKSKSYEYLRISAGVGAAMQAVPAMSRLDEVIKQAQQSVVGNWGLVKASRQASNARPLAVGVL